MKAVFGVLAIALLVVVVVARPDDKKAAAPAKDAAKDGKSPLDGVKKPVDGGKKAVDGVTKGVGDVKPPALPGHVADKPGGFISEGIKGIGEIVKDVEGTGKHMVASIFSF